ncbi:MAG: UDP-glucose/GDP-mannose dehydrogenase family protein [Saprospiraceae bacterium]|nr:UDP-glucose/GDP-mannose dehydrogenase family protein [Saprospiraceae bacterium]
MKISVIGTGYVGLVTGTCFAETGNQVMCVDIDENKVDRLKNGKITIYEPGLETIFERNLAQGRLEFTTDLTRAAAHGDIIFLALPTPPGADGAADLSYVLKVAADLSQLIEEYTVVVNKSTVPVGTAEKVSAVLGDHLPADRYDVVSNPEFLREGVAVDDFLKPDRVVIGSNSERATSLMRQLYEPFVRQGNPILTMDIRSAEMTKYAANAYLATRISFMNEIANLCEQVGADVDWVRRGIGSDTRIGKRFLFPGIGYGGSCFPKDVQALHRTASQHDYEFRILDAVMQTNDAQKNIITSKILNYFSGNLTGKTIAVWGLAFKPNTDDIREAPSLRIVEELLRANASVKVFDPEAMDNFKQIFGDKLTYASEQYEALVDADALAILTEWSVFRTPSFEVMKNLLTDPIIFDGRNLYNLDRMAEQGFYYNSIGRSLVGTRKHTPSTNQ